MCAAGAASQHWCGRQAGERADAGAAAGGAGQCGLCAASQSRPGRQVVREKNVAVCSQSWRILIRSDPGHNDIS